MCQTNDVLEFIHSNNKNYRLHNKLKPWRRKRERTLNHHTKMKNKKHKLLGYFKVFLSLFQAFIQLFIHAITHATFTGCIHIQCVSAVSGTRNTILSVHNNIKMNSQWFITYHCYWHFICVMPFNSHNNLMREVQVFSPFYRCENWG